MKTQAQPSPPIVYMVLFVYITLTRFKFMIVLFRLSWSRILVQ